jgi:hypothetical protein
MVSVATLENIHDTKPEVIDALNRALLWWKYALIPTLLGVPPLKEIMWRHPDWYERVRWLKVALLVMAVVLILVGIVFFILASYY